MAQTALEDPSAEELSWDTLTAGLDELRKALTTGTTPEIACRVDLIARLLVVVHGMRQVQDAVFDFSADGCYDAVYAFVPQALALHRFLMEQPALTIGVRLDGFDDVDVPTLATRASERAIEMLKGLWKASLDAGKVVQGTAQGHSISEAVLDDKNMLFDIATRNTIPTNEGGKELASDVRACKRAHMHLAKIHRHEPKFFEGYASLDEALKSQAVLARKNIGVEHTLREIFVSFPTKKSEVPQHVQTVIDDLRKYGCSLPAFLDAFVRDLLDKSNADIVAPSGDVPAEEQDEPAAGSEEDAALASDRECTPKGAGGRQGKAKAAPKKAARDGGRGRGKGLLSQRTIEGMLSDGSRKK